LQVVQAVHVPPFMKVEPVQSPPAPPPLPPPVPSPPPLPPPLPPGGVGSPQLQPANRSAVASAAGSNRERGDFETALSWVIARRVRKAGPKDFSWRGQRGMAMDR
jgi:hypothetical protein